MLCLSGFQQYSRWVPLKRPKGRGARRNGCFRRLVKLTLYNHNLTALSDHLPHINKLFKYTRERSVTCKTPLNNLRSQTNPEI